MGKLMKVRLSLAFGLAVLGGFLIVAGNAEARPQYLKSFTETYPTVEEASKVKCNVCHFGKSKKNRNPYGEVMGKSLGKKNEKAADAIKEALAKSEKEKSQEEGKTFGDLLKEGKLPAIAEETE